MKRIKRNAVFGIEPVTFWLSSLSFTSAPLLLIHVSTISKYKA
jgi:hypothetical protein